MDYIEKLVIDIPCPCKTFLPLDLSSFQSCPISQLNASLILLACVVITSQLPYLLTLGLHHSGIITLGNNFLS